LFAIEEESSGVPNTVSDRRILVDELKLICKETNILDRLSAISVAIKHGKKVVDKDGYYILILDYEKYTVRIRYFMASQNEEAREVYNHIESQKKNSSIDAVLVRASSFSMVKEAYPNYFMDIREFVIRINGYIYKR
jgi:hypothetical protein